MVRLSVTPPFFFLPGWREDLDQDLGPGMEDLRPGEERQGGIQEELDLG